MSKARDTQSRMEYMRKYQDKKKRYEKTRPFLMNYIPYNIYDLERLEVDDLVLSVTNLLDNEDKKWTVLKKLSGSVGHELIDAIECPDCGATIYRHKYWDCYICFCGGIKKVYDIMEIKSAKIDIYEKQLNEIRSVEIAKLRGR